MLCVLHELHVAEVREALAADRVARGVDADLDVDAGQIAKRVGVLGAGQPPDRHAARARRRASASYALSDVADPGRRRRALVVGRELLVGLERRHHAGLEHLGDLFPVLPVLADRRAGSTSFSMLRPASGFLVPWHSKQYFWNAAGGMAEGRGVCAGAGANRGAAFADAARRGPNVGAWADRIDASATTEAAHNAGRVMELQATVRKPVPAL